MFDLKVPSLSLSQKGYDMYKDLFLDALDDIL